MDKRLNLKGQVGIFILIGIVLIALLSLFLLFNRTPELQEEVDSSNPENFLRTCIREKTFDTLQTMIVRGGLLTFEKNITYYKQDILYHCYTSGNYMPCVNQHPSLLEEARIQLLEEIKPEINSCFTQLKEENERRNRIIEGELNEINLEFVPGSVKIKLIGPITISGDNSQRYEEFDFNFAHPIYDLLSVSQDIAKSESQTCYFEYVGYMAVYPRFEIEKNTLSDSTKIYTIKDTFSDTKMEVAIRGCAIPPGL